MSEFVEVRPKTKKSFVEVSIYEKDGNKVSVDTVYRWGTAYVRKDLLPEPEFEDDNLDINALDGGMIDIFDVCEEDFVEREVVDYDLVEQFIEAFQEDPWIVEDELGWELVDGGFYIENGWEVVGDYEE